MTTASLTNEEVIRSFPCYQGPAASGFAIDFLGARTRCEFLSVLGPHKEHGLVEGYPFPANFHATTLEWAGALRAVLGAGRQFVAVELGAGWAPWLVSLACAARFRGITDFRLVGVEGCQRRCDYMRTNFRDNGLVPEEHALLHGVVGPYDGLAEFPEQADASVDYGSSAQFEGPAPSRWQRLRAGARRLLGRLKATADRRGAALGQVRCYSLPSLLAPLPTVDLLHVDIQGHEHAVLASAPALLWQKVRWLVVGTHGRTIEEQLRRDLAAQGWAREGDEACQFKQQRWSLVLIRDGCQVWRNPTLTSAARQAA